MQQALLLGGRTPWSWGGAVSVLLSPYQNRVPFEQVLPGLELGPCRSGLAWGPAIWCCPPAGSAETQRWDGAATAVSVACGGDVCGAARHGVGPGTQLCHLWGWELIRPWGMGNCPQSPRDIKRDVVMALVCLDLLICPVHHECDHEPWVWVGSPQLLASGVHMGVPICMREWSRQVTITTSFSRPGEMVPAAMMPQLPSRQVPRAGQNRQRARASCGLESSAGAVAETTHVHTARSSSGARSHGAGLQQGCLTPSRALQVNQGNMPGIQSTFLAMDTEEGVEVVWNELLFTDKKAFKAHEVSHPSPAGTVPTSPETAHCTFLGSSASPCCSWAHVSQQC